MPELDRIRAYIATVRWQNAKTLAKTAPHEYTIREWTPAREGDFVFFVQWIRANGYARQWGKRTFVYFDVDGFKYWTMGDTLDNTIVLNREPLTRPQV
jgi:hypothetical protein